MGCEQTLYAAGSIDASNAIWVHAISGIDPGVDLGWVVGVLQIVFVATPWFMHPLAPISMLPLECHVVCQV